MTLPTGMDFLGTFSAGQKIQFRQSASVIVGLSSGLD